MCARNSYGCKLYNCRTIIPHDVGGVDFHSNLYADVAVHFRMPCSCSNRINMHACDVIWTQIR